MKEKKPKKNKNLNIKIQKEQDLKPLHQATPRFSTLGDKGRLNPVGCGIVVVNGVSIDTNAFKKPQNITK